MDDKWSFNIYVIQGGTNFGFWAGANYNDRYLPHVTSYDFDAPINEDGTLHLNILLTEIWFSLI